MGGPAFGSEGFFSASGQSMLRWTPWRRVKKTRFSGQDLLMDHVKVVTDDVEFTRELGVQLGTTSAVVSAVPKCTCQPRSLESPGMHKLRCFILEASMMLANLATDVDVGVTP